MKLKEVITGNEIITNNDWFVLGHQGNRVFIKGYLAPVDKNKIGYDFAKNKLLKLLKEKDFVLRAPEFWPEFGYDVLVCELYLNNVNIKNYFPELKSEGVAEVPPTVVEPEPYEMPTESNTPKTETILGTSTDATTDVTDPDL